MQARNHPWQAAKKLEQETTEVHWTQVDEKQPWDIVLVDKQTTSRAAWWAPWSNECPDFDVTGFTHIDIGTLLKQLGTADDATDA